MENYSNFFKQRYSQFHSESFGVKNKQNDKKYLILESIPDSAPASYDFRVPSLSHVGDGGAGSGQSTRGSIRSQSNLSLGRDEDLGIIGQISFDKSDQSNETSDECMFPAVRNQTLSVIKFKPSLVI